jgi:hypothetical protein
LLVVNQGITILITNVYVFNISFWKLQILIIIALKINNLCIIREVLSHIYYYWLFSFPMRISYIYIYIYIYIYFFKGKKGYRDENLIHIRYIVVLSALLELHFTRALMWVGGGASSSNIYIYFSKALGFMIIIIHSLSLSLSISDTARERKREKESTKYLESPAFLSTPDPTAIIMSSAHLLHRHHCSHTALSFALLNHPTSHKASSFPPARKRRKKKKEKGQKQGHPRHHHHHHVFAKQVVAFFIELASWF